jgi:predicted ATPase
MLRMLKEIAHQYRIQVLIATHSPLMITEDTISHVYRLHRKDKGTHVTNSLQHFTAYESNLIQMLQFGYIAKVFFVQKIIMVE